MTTFNFGDDDDDGVTENPDDPDGTTGFIFPGDEIFCINCSVDNPGTPLIEILPGFMWVEPDSSALPTNGGTGLA